MSDDDWDWSPAQPAAPPSSNAPVQTADGNWDWRKPQADAPKPVYSGRILPLTRYSDDTVGFDPEAGITGMAKNAVSSLWSGATLPHDVAMGKVIPDSPEGIRRSLDMATLAAPDAAVLTARKMLTPPTAKDLQETGGAAYNAIRGMGVDRTIPHTAALAQKIQDGLFNDGLSERVAPPVHALLNELQNPKPGAVAVPTSALITARRELGNIAKDYSNKPQQLAAQRAQKAIDDYIINPPPESVLSGPADDAGRLFAEANKNYAAGARSDVLNQRGEYAQYKANDSNAGQNLPNNLRKQASYFLDPTHPARSAGFSDDELAALERVNRGDRVTNAARAVGSWLGAGHGVLAGAGIAEAAHQGYNAYGLPGLAVGAIPPAVGMAAKAIEKSRTKGAFQNVDELLRSRSPLAEQRQANAPFEVSAEARPTLAAKAPGSASVAAAPSAAQTPPQSTTPPPKVTPLPRKGPKPPPMTEEEAARYVQQLRPGDTFARGGAVKPKLKHEELVSRLMDASEKAKLSAKRDTKAILNVPDNTVAKALAVAQKAI